MSKREVIAAIVPSRDHLPTAADLEAARERMETEARKAGFSRIARLRYTGTDPLDDFLDVGPRSNLLAHHFRAVAVA